MPAPAAEGGLPYPGLSPEAHVVLATLGSARDRLARQLVQEDSRVTGPDLNSAVFSSILRVLFLNVGERSGFVEPGTLALIAESEGIGKRMARACSDAGLPAAIFSAGGSPGSREPALPDAALREFIGRIGAPEFLVLSASLAPEDFAVLLEYLLSTRLEISDGYRVRSTGKSAMLYTGSVDVPARQVVAVITEGTLREILRDTPPDAGAIRILDPACGAGIFLLAAYRFLIRNTAAGSPEEILRRSISGVDIDPESVSAARFILLRTCIEEIRASKSGPVDADRIRKICTVLADNVLCGNTLVAPDYFAGKPEFPFNADERRRVNPFDWQAAFPEIFSAGGFTAMLCAPPPYRPFSVKAREEYFQTHFEAYAPSAGLYVYFIEKGLSLLRSEGMMTVHLPGTFLRSRHARPLRKLLLTRQIVTVADTGRTRAILDSDVRMYILRLRNEPPARPFLVSRGPVGMEDRPASLSGMPGFLLDQRSLDDGGWTLEDTRTADLMEKIYGTGTPLDTYVMGEVIAGSHRVRNNPLVVDAATRARLTKKAGWCRRLFVPLLRPADIRRYVPEMPSRFEIAIGNQKDLRKCRDVAKYLKESGHMGDDDGPAEIPEHYDADAGVENFTQATEPGHKYPKIVFSLYQHGPAFCYDATGSFTLANGLAAIPRNDPFLAAILNSSLGRFIITHTCPLTDRGYHLGPAHLLKFPVIAPDFDNRTDRIRYERIVALVARMMSLHEYLRKAKTDQELRLVRQEIDATDVKIDALIYEIYGLSAEEITVIEEDSA